MVTLIESYPLRWIALLPLLAALYHGAMLGVVGRPTPRWLVVALSGGAALGAFLATFASFLELIRLPTEGALLLDDVATWVGSGFGPENLTAEIALALDPLAAVLCLVVTGVVALVHVYAAGYLLRDVREDAGPQRFHAILDLLLFALLTLLLADGLVTLFVGWQLVGVCCQLLVGFWYMDAGNADRGLHVALVNRIGDVGVFAGFLVLFSAGVGASSVAFRDLPAALPTLGETWLSVPLVGDVSALHVAAACIALGVLAKTAQLPFGVGHLRATTGPPPGAALLYTVTGGLAGVYLLCRLAPLLAEAPGAATGIAWAGGATALLAAAAAAVQRDLQRGIACVASSQLGFALLAAGCGAHAAALFQVGTLAFGAALLLLCAGSVGLATHGEQGLERLGGLWARLPVTHLLFLVGVLALAGVPPLSGFFSKQAVLAAGFASELPGHASLYRAALATAGLCAFALWRMQCLVFYGRQRLEASRADRVEEPDRWLARPLWALAGLAVLGGFVGLPQVWGDVLGVEGSNSLANFVEPALGVAASTALDGDVESGIAAALLIAVVLGLGLAHAAHARRSELLLPKPRVGAPDRVVLGERLAAAAVRWLSERVVSRVVEGRLVRGLAVEGPTRAVRGLANAGLKRVQSGYVQGYVFVALLGALAVVGLLVR